jgi:dephospho-CoA kinase
MIIGITGRAGVGKTFITTEGNKQLNWKHIQLDSVGHE